MDTSFSSGSSSRALLEFGAKTSTDSTDFDISTFKTDGFSDFELDLTCLSNPPSPVLPTTALEAGSSENTNVSALTHIPVPKRSPSLKSMTLPFFTPSSSNPKLLPSDRDSATSPSPKLTPVDPLRSSDPRGSWPLVKYVGRGTPIDQTRRIEWGSPGEISEHGVLFSGSGLSFAGRGNSLDSGIRPFHSTSDWHRHGHGHGHAGTLPLPGSSTRPISPLQLKLEDFDRDSSQPQPEPPTQRFIEALPEASRLKITGLDEPSDPDEWSGVMKAVMKTGSGEQNGSAVNPALPEKKKKPEFSILEKKDTTSSENISPKPAVSNPTLIPHFDAVLKKLDEAVDLGLGRLGERDGANGGMNFFNLGLIPGSSDIGYSHRASGTGRETPSMYSTAPPTPESPRSRSSSPALERRNGAERRRSEEVGEIAEVHVDEEDDERETQVVDDHVAREHWWKKLFSRLRKLQVLLRAHQSRV
ncbi:hypothetical protein WG66_002434 [Moniliophthora roreri]|uniref:Uncharacterized protein n=1 Tax=Moniliophthora roreri TaxID=221103 RepID=A0A0W0F7Z7_MONRR|nr:hypothetical protein WG66_002434 [Moniliophthora roreri]